MPREDLIRLRQGSTASWTAANPVLASGEPGYDTTTKQIRIGDGLLPWLNLPAINLPGPSGLTRYESYADLGAVTQSEVGVLVLNSAEDWAAAIADGFLPPIYVSEVEGIPGSVLSGEFLVATSFIGLSGELPPAGPDEDPLPIDTRTMMQAVTFVSPETFVVPQAFRYGWITYDQGVPDGPFWAPWTHGDGAMLEILEQFETYLTSITEQLEGRLSEDALSATFVRGIDATAYGSTADGSFDCYAALEALGAAVQAAGGGTIFLPGGTYRISHALTPRSRVRWQGAGIGVTIIKPYQSAAWTGHGTLADPIESPAWADMTWDGSSISTSNPVKGQWSEYMRNALWERVECKDFTATGFGSDYLPGGRYLFCISTGNGRGQTVGDPGMSGFGIGTGMYAVEDVLVMGCTATGNKNYGIFVEKQGSDVFAPYFSRGVRFIGNRCYGNAWGIGGCGVDSPIYSENVCHGNTYDGIILHEGTGVSPLGQPDKHAVITNNQCYSNGRDGISADYALNSLNANAAHHLIANNIVWGNTRDGIRLVSSKWNSDVVRGITVQGNKVSRNTGQGINVVTASGAESAVYFGDLSIRDNDVNGNGGTAGIRIACHTTRLLIADNKVYDDQASRTQDYGIETVTGYTLTDTMVKDNRLLLQLTSAVSLSATWAGHSVLVGNNGYSPGWASITLGASPAAYTCGVTPETVYIAGGTVSSIKITPYGSTQATFLLVAHATVMLEPGDILDVTYSVLPTSTKAHKRQ